MDAILYAVRSGCQWRMLPRDFPSWSTVYGIVRRWRLAGLSQQIHDALPEQVRKSEGKKLTPTAAVIDSQSARTAANGAKNGP
jgi:putative transposase